MVKNYRRKKEREKLQHRLKRARLRELRNSSQVRVEHMITIEENSAFTCKEEFTFNQTNMQDNPQESLYQFTQDEQKSHQANSFYDPLHRGQSGIETIVPFIKSEFEQSSGCTLEPNLSFNSSSENIIPSEDVKFNQHIANNNIKILNEKLAEEFILPTLTPEPFESVAVKQELLEPDFYLESSIEVEDSIPPETSGKIRTYSKRSPSKNRLLVLEQNVVHENPPMSAATAFIRQRNGKGERFVCDRCHNVIEIRKSMGIHLHYCFNELYLVCEICRAMFSNRNDLENHLRVHVNNTDKTLKCDLCDMVFVLQADLTNHILTHMSDKQHCCPLCPSKFKRESNLTKHMTCHESEEHLTCKICKETFKNQKDLAFHIPIHVADRPEKYNPLVIKSRIGNTRFRCKVCDNIFGSRRKLLQHMEIHPKRRTYDCQMCDSTFTSWKVFALHSEVRHSKKPFECKLCKMGFSLKKEYEKHLSLHADHTKQPFLCQVCQLGFPLSRELRTHMSEHHPHDVSFSCQVCHSNYPCENTLAMHMISHAGWEHFLPNVGLS